MNQPFASPALRIPSTNISEPRTEIATKRTPKRVKVNTRDTRLGGNFLDSSGVAASGAVMANAHRCRLTAWLASSAGPSSWASVGWSGCPRGSKLWRIGWIADFYVVVQDHAIGVVGDLGLVAELHRLAQTALGIGRASGSWRLTSRLAPSGVCPDSLVRGSGPRSAPCVPGRSATPVRPPHGPLTGSPPQPTGAASRLPNR
jgi:hypothetical protein